MASTILQIEYTLMSQIAKNHLVNYLEVPFPMVQKDKKTFRKASY